MSPVIVLLDEEDNAESSTRSKKAAVTAAICHRKPKDHYQQFFTRRRTEDAVRGSRRGRLHFRTRSFCSEEESNFESFIQFKNHILKNHSDQQVLKPPVFLVKF